MVACITQESLLAFWHDFVSRYKKGSGTRRVEAQKQKGTKEEGERTELRIMEDEIGENKKRFDSLSSLRLPSFINDVGGERPMMNPIS